MSKSVVEMGMELLRQQNSDPNAAASAGDEQMPESSNETGPEDEPVGQEETGGEQEDPQVNTVLAGLVDRLDQLAAVLDGLLGRLGVGSGMSAPSQDAQYAAGGMKES